MADKTKTLATSLNLKNDRLLFSGSTEGNNPIAIDYIPPFGDNLGYTSLELLMLSLSSCISTAILVILRKQNKTILNFSVNTTGTRRETHPTILEEIQLSCSIKSPDLSTKEFEQTLQMAENICPVWFMIKNCTKVNINHLITK